MRFARTLALVSVFAAGCAAPPVAPACDGSACGDGAPPVHAASQIEHLLVIVQENHTFDNYFGRYCTAPTGSNPTCTVGAACCEAGPATDPSGATPFPLTDKENGAYTPNHTHDCEVDAIDGGKMDRFVTGALCGSPHNFAYAPPSLVMPYWKLADGYALADHYFQPYAGETSANDMYLARARFVFADNSFEPNAIGKLCSFNIVDNKSFNDQTIGDLLVAAGVPWAWYAEGYQAMIDATRKKTCPTPPPDCPAAISTYPCDYDGADVPFQYFPAFTDNPIFMKDLSALAADLAAGRLPAVSFVKALGYKTEHPTAGTTVSAGVAFVDGVVQMVLASPYGGRTLILLTYDEGGGYFDHVAPPPPSAVDQQPYGTRVPMLAIGRFARQGAISHTTLEHSSIVKFIEWNWLDRQTGQLGTRDATVNNLGSLLDPAATGVAIPE